MDRGNLVQFPVAVTGRDIRAVVPAAADIPENAVVQVCADGTVSVEEPEDASRVSSVRLTEEQVQWVLQAHNALQAATLPPR